MSVQARATLGPRTFATPMPVHRIAQKHGDPHREDNYGFLRDLCRLCGADVNARVVFNDHTKRTKKSGCHIFAFHGESAASNGFTHRMVGGRCRKMSTHDLHRDIRSWDAHEVFTWRRGPSANSPRPITINSVYRYCRAHGGQPIVELKAREFRFKWIMQQLVQDAHRHNMGPYFKALASMAYFEQKAVATAEATVTLPSGKVVHGWFAVIYGDRLKGQARQRQGERDTAHWPAHVRAQTRIW